MDWQATIIFLSYSCLSITEIFIGKLFGLGRGTGYRKAIHRPPPMRQKSISVAVVSCRISGGQWTVGSVAGSELSGQWRAVYCRVSLGQWTVGSVNCRISSGQWTVGPPSIRSDMPSLLIFANKEYTSREGIAYT